MYSHSDDLLRLYRKMVTIRVAERFISSHYAEDEMKCPMHMSYGQEAVAVGVLDTVGDRAISFSSYRSHAAYLARTGDVEGFFAELYGKAAGPNQGYAGSMHITGVKHWLSSGIVGAQIPIAVGAAMGFHKLGTGQVAVVFFGDGAMGEGVFWESLNIASVYHAPVLFVCEDNKLAVHTPQELRGRPSVKNLGLVFPNLHSDVVSGHDVQEVVSATQGALEAIGSGCPAILQVECCRYLEHVGVGEDRGASYRVPGRAEAWMECDAVEIARRRLDAQKVADALEDVTSRVRVAVARARKLEFANPEKMLERVYR